MRHKLLFRILLAFGFAAWLCLFLFSSLTPPRALDLTMLNVGQGESVLIREPAGHTLLYDGGPTDAVLSELGAVLPPWQRSLDLVVLSHNHSDHLRGLISVLSRYRVGDIWISGAVQKSEDYRAFLETMQKQGLRPRIMFFNPTGCRSGQPCPPPHYLGKLMLQVYHPLSDMTGREPKDQHDATLSIKVSYGDHSVLLAGDLNEGHERSMIAACVFPCNLAATILQVPHHGSRTGLSPPFLAAVAPLSALIPVGLDNKFGHPSPQILQRLGQAKVPTYRTDTQGRIHLILPERGPPQITTQF